MNKVAKDRELYLENYWLKNKRAIEKGKNGPDLRLGGPGRAAPQGRRRRHGQRTAPPGRGGPHGQRRLQGRAAWMWPPGDYVIRGDQPYRTLVDMYFSVQNYPTANPRPYDDTGWTMQYMRNVKLNNDRRQGDPRKADDAAHRRCQGGRRRRRLAAASWSWSTPATTT